MADHPEYTATIVWERPADQVFTSRTYSRDHEWRLDGLSVPASSSPLVVRPPLSSADRIDPEEALVASLSSCHMLTFLYLAARRGLTIDRYEDHAAGRMGRNADGRIAMLAVHLRPQVTFGGEGTIDAEALHALHEAAHRECYIANSVKCEVLVEPRDAAGA